MTRRLLLTLALLLAAPATASAELKMFRSPTGKIGCETKRFHGLKCTSRRKGMTCRNTRSGHGFKVSVEKRRLF